MNTNYRKRIDKVENMLDFLKIPFSKITDLFNNETTYYIVINDLEEVEITVRQPRLNRTALTWKHADFIFNGSFGELEDFIETLRPQNNVVPIK